MDKTKILAYRCIIPGAFFTLAGPVMLAIPELRSAAWGVIIAGPGLVLLGLYILKRSGPS